MNEQSVRRRRVEPSSLTGLLAVGDLVAIGLFVLAGEVSHGYGLVEHAGRVAGVLATFIIGWAVVSVPGRMYTRGAIADVETAVFRTLLVWALAVGIVQTLRSTSIFPGDFAVTFALVSFGVVGTLLVTWRVGATFLA